MPPARRKAIAGCHGVEKVYSYDGPIIPDDSLRIRASSSSPTRSNATSRLSRQAQGDAPKTLVELTGRAVSASRKGLRNARSALGGASPTATNLCLRANPYPTINRPRLAPRMPQPSVPMRRIPIGCSAPAAPWAACPQELPLTAAVYSAIAAADSADGGSAQ